MKTLITLIAVSVICALCSCDSRPGPGLNPEEVKTMSLVGADGSVRTTLPEKDARTLAEYFSRMEFDVKFNDSAAAVRMASPEYSLVISYGKAGRADDWMHVWITSGRVMFRSKWYLLRADDLQKAATILSRFPR